VQLLKLRFLQIKRDLGYWVIIIAAVVFFAAQGISEVSLNYALGLAGVFLFFLYAYHTNRKDLNFINKYFDEPKTNLCINYNLITLPVSIAIMVCGYWLITLALHLSVTSLIFLKIKVGGPKLVFIRKYIPSSQFEWIAGLRKNLFLIIPLLLIAIFFSPVKLFGVLALFLLNSTLLGFYSSFEPLVMLNPEGHTIQDFLKHKIGFFTKVILILNVPLLLINSVFQPDVAWYDVCFLGGFLLLASCSIYIKYESYKPNEELHFSIDSLFLYASALIPFLVPIAFFLNSQHKKKAIQNLSNYIDD